MTLGTTRLKFAIFSGVLTALAIYAYAYFLTLSRGDGPYWPSWNIVPYAIGVWLLVNGLSWLLRRGDKDLLDSTPLVEPHKPLDPLPPVPDYLTRNKGTDNKVVAVPKDIASSEVPTRVEKK